MFDTNDENILESVSDENKTMHSIASIKKKEQIAYGLYSQLSSLENFYSRIQSNYKRVATSWLFATLFGMGYISSVEGNNLPLSPKIILIFITFAAIWGITVLWYLDIYIYQTYFYGVAIEQAKLEKKYTWLPTVNINIIGISLEHIKKKYSFQSYLYIGCQWILLFITSLITMSLVNFQPLYSTLIFIGFVVIGGIIAFIFLRVEHPKESPVRTQFKEEFFPNKKP